MISFFRKIRYQLTREGALKRYLIYAFGEIILVMVGILLALQVNNWNENRKLRLKNNDNLASLRSELVANQQVLKENIERVKVMIRIGMDMIDSLNNGVVPDVQKDQYLLDKLGNLGPLRFRPLTVATLEEIINSGSYSSILSDEVKDKMLAYSSRLEELSMTMNRFDESFKSVELPYLTRHLSIVDMLTNRSEEINAADQKLVGDGLPDFKRDNYYFSSDHQAFFNNREFTSMLTNRYFDIRAVLKTMIWLDTSIDELLKSIDGAEDQ